MRSFMVLAGLVLLQSSVLATEKTLTFSMIEMNFEVRGGIAHLVEVSLDDNGQLRMQDHSLTPMTNGGYTGVVRQNLEDGSITAVFRIHQQEREYSGDYTIVSGSGAYAGAHGQGSLTTLSGYAAAASSTGIYKVVLQVTTPERRIAADQ
jgi:hypothetical protein